MTVGKLFLKTLGAILLGGWRNGVYFDTEAKAYTYHLAKIGQANWQDMYGNGSLRGRYFLLFEERFVSEKETKR